MFWKSTHEQQLVLQLEEKKTEKQYQDLKEEMENRNRLLQQNILDYKLSLIQAKDTKKRIQNENGAYWKK